MSTTEPTTTLGLPSRAAWTAGAASALLTWAAFFPFDWGVLGWIAPVPLIVLVRLPVPPHRISLPLYLTTLVGTAASLQWMRLGDTWMIPAWLSLSAYLAIYTPLLVAVARTAVHRFKVPIGGAVPLAWVATEYAKAHVMTGLAWYFLGHTQYRFVELIQVSDLVGAYGVSFLVALAATSLALALPTSWLSRCGWWPADEGNPAPSVSPRQTSTTIIATVVLIGLALGYGTLRRGQAQFTSGPRVALVQGNFTSSLKHDPEAFANIYRVHRRLTGLAVQEQPDVIVWPETMFRYPLLEAAEGLDDEQLREVAPRIPPGEWKKTLAASAAAASASDDDDDAVDGGEG